MSIPTMAHGIPKSIHPCTGNPALLRCIVQFRIAAAGISARRCDESVDPIARFGAAVDTQNKNIGPTRTGR